MSVRHQVSDELLLDYASGSLSEGWRIAVASHLALSPQSRRRLAVMELTAGALIEEEQPESFTADDDDAWSAMRTRLAAGGGALSGGVDTPRPVSRDAIVLPEPLRSYAGGDVGSLKWRPLGRGAYHILIPTADKSTSVRLLRIPAGKPVPEHGHGGRELTLVLSGSFNDGGEIFARGDLEEADETLEHQPVATSGEDCICLAVTDAPLKFRSWLVRLVQPVLGI